MGYPELADDFAQEVAMQNFRGRKATPTQLFIDLLRKEYGDARIDSGKLRIFNTNPKYSRAICLDKEVPGSGELAHSVENGAGGDSASQRPLGGNGRDTRIKETFFKEVKERLRAVLVLRFHFDFLLKDIAYVLGVSESRVSQMLDTALRAQKKRITKESAFKKKGILQPASQRALSLAEDNSWFFREEKKIVAMLCRKEKVFRPSLGQTPIAQIPQEILGTFAVSSF